MNHLKNFPPSKETLQVDELITVSTEVNEHLTFCKRKLSLYLEEVKENLEKQPEKKEILFKNINNIKDDLLVFDKTFNNFLKNDVKVTENIYQELSEELNEVTISNDIVHIICEVHKNIASLKQFCDNIKDYKMAVEIADILKVSMKNFPFDTSTPVTKELKKEVNFEINKMNSLFVKQFEENFVMVNENGQATIRICVDQEKLKLLLNVIYENAPTKELVTQIFHFVWEDLLLNSLQTESEINIGNFNDCKVLTIKKHSTNSHDDYLKLYQNLQQIFEFLVKYSNVSLGDQKLIHKMGQHLKKQLAEKMKDMLLKYIPNDWQSFEEFNKSLNRSTQELEKKLKPHNWFGDEWNFLDHLETFYIKRKCKYFNDKAKEIMKKDLHNMIEIGTTYDPSKPTMNGIRCAVSSNIQELIILGDEILHEIQNNKLNFFETYRVIFYNYGDFVAKYHQKLLETIPQQVALFYNNCNYLTEKIREWNEQIGNQDEFSDDVLDTGKVYFDFFVEEQKKQLDNILKGTGLSDVRSLDKLNDNIEKFIRQCLRQQELLRTVWSKVLSYPVYNETMGDILNSMCRYLINSIVQIEDIDSAVAEQLVDVLKIILTRGPKLFTDPTEVFVYVPQWARFNELIFVLGASLADICDRWADGKGPLSVLFKTFELKQLIRALFQNTERRAAVLAKIHE